jgi:flavin-dependent dehydrogenase
MFDAVKTLEYDVLVVGGGPGGCGAAAAAGKRGVRTTHNHLRSRSHVSCKT